MKRLGPALAVSVMVVLLLGWSSSSEGALRAITPPSADQSVVGKVTVLRGGTVQVLGASLSVPSAAVATDTYLKLSTLRLDQSAEGNGIDGAVQLLPSESKAAVLNASALLTFRLATPRKPGSHIPFFMLLYQSEIDPKTAPQDNFPVYVPLGNAAVDKSGAQASVRIGWLNQRYVLKDNQEALSKYRQKASALKSVVLPSGLFREQPDVLNGPRAVILIHGNNSNQSLFDRAHWQACIDYFAQHHANQFQLYTFIYDTQDEQKGVSDCGRELANAIQAHPELPEHFMLVGHSLGGLVARSYLVQYGGAARVDRLITLAAPHHGSPQAIPLWGRYSLYGGFKDVQEKVVGGWFPVINYLKCAMRSGSGFEDWVIYGDTNPWPLFRDSVRSSRDMSWNNYDDLLPTVANDYRWDKSLIGVSVAGRYTGYPDFMHPADYLSPDSLDEQRSNTRNDFLQQLSLGGPASDQALLDRYVLYGGYDPDLSDNATLQQALFGQTFKFLGDTWRLVLGPYGLSWQTVPDPGVAVTDAWADHTALSYTIARLAETIGAGNTRPYRLNDGLVTLASSLYLAPGRTLKSVDTVPLVGGPGDLPGFQAHKYRIYPGFDHLSIVTGDLPGSTLLEDLASDLLEAEP